jgi:hypothetical protein
VVEHAYRKELVPEGGPREVVSDKPTFEAPAGRDRPGANFERLGQIVNHNITEGRPFAQVQLHDSRARLHAAYRRAC